MSMGSSPNIFYGKRQKGSSKTMLPPFFLLNVNFQSK